MARVAVQVTGENGITAYNTYVTYDGSTPTVSSELVASLAPGAANADGWVVMWVPVSGTTTFLTFAYTDAFGPGSNAVQINAMGRGHRHDPEGDPIGQQQNDGGHNTPAAVRAQF